MSVVSVGARRELVFFLALSSIGFSGIGSPRLLDSADPTQRDTRAGGERSETEAQFSIDVKDASIKDVLRLMAEVGSFQVVIDSEVSCSLTMKLTQVRWETALQMALRSCGLAQEEENGIVRVAPAPKLLSELRSRQQLAEERRLNQPMKTTLFRLSYARAQEIAPILQKFLSPRGRVIFDVRTNTLLVTDIP